MRVIHTYGHHNGRVGVIAEFEIETALAARTSEFKAFMERVCFALAAVEPLEEGRSHQLSLGLTGETIGEGIRCVDDDELTVDRLVRQTAEQFGEAIKIARAEVWFGLIT